MKICVTGGAGFIGSNFLRSMVNAYPNDFFVCIDKLTYSGRIANLAPLFELNNFKFICADITDSHHINSIFMGEKFDAVVNFAAETHVDNSIKDPDIFVKTNIMGTQVLLEACRKNGNIRFHQVSTDEVYGDLPLDRPDLLFTEESPIKPSSPYSASKASADMLVMAYYRTFGLPITISRCSNNYGRFQFPEKLIPLVISRALEDKPIPVYGNGGNIRDWIHVDDHCCAVDTILRYGKIGEVYNVGGNTEITNLFMVKSILQMLNKPESLISFVTDRAGHDLRYAIDNRKLMNELNWRHEIPFFTGLLDTVEYYKQLWQTK